MTSSHIIFCGLSIDTNTTELDLSSKRIVSIEVLSQLQNLENLILYDNKIKDISPLSKLKKLKYLNLGKNKITDISSLSKLKKLVMLDVRSNLIEDISCINSLTNLLVLDISNNLIEDISSIEHCSKLINLVGDNNYITNLTPLEKLNKLQIISVANNEITDISALCDLMSLCHVNIVGNDITSLPLQVTHLKVRSFKCDENKITNICDLDIKHWFMSMRFSYSPPNLELDVHSTLLQERVMASVTKLMKNWEDITIDYHPYFECEHKIGGMYTYKEIYQAICIEINKIPLVGLKNKIPSPIRFIAQENVRKELESPSINICIVDKITRLVKCLDGLSPLVNVF